MTLTLLLRYWKQAAIVALCVTVFGFCMARDHALQAKGVAEERARQADSILKALAPQLAHADSVFVHDTAKVTKYVTTYQTIRDTVLQHLTDTLTVERFVQVADSTIHACTDALGTCEKRIALITTEKDAWKAKAQAAPVIAVKSCVAPTLIGGAVGLAVGFLAHR